MSMSQEEIEALMNGLDISDDENESSESTDTTVDTSEIDELISQTQNEEELEPNPVLEEVNDSVEESSTNIEEEPKVEEMLSFDETETSDTVDNDDIDALLKDLEAEGSSQEGETEIFDDLENNSLSENSSDDFDDIMSQIDGITEETQSTNEPVQVKEKVVEEDINADKIVKDWTDTKINEGVIPLPAEKDTKVVSQLNQVANDSEEKVSQIFDVLSLSLDNNNAFRTKVSEMDELLVSQNKLLMSLHAKFPNIEIFKSNIEKIEEVNKSLESMKSIMNEEDMKIFEAMELMQFNDINRQKIERVMSVIRKLSLYLNNLFEDEYTDQEIAVAKHIHGDEGEVLIGEDLDKLIEEFGK
ncbi:hypothetical protein ACH5BK_06570 [Arcobacter sp. YIC-80]|uniref:hypothetical protein n=1 Tax=Arcobacter sp. YIC-80 TaxID=3376683 RepID=UPI00384FE24C